MRRITVTLTEDERQALYDLAQAEHRDTRKQAAWLIRKGLEGHGLLSDERREARATTASSAGVQDAR